MDPRRLLLTLRLDIRAAARRARSRGVWQLLGVLAGGVLLVGAEVWVTSRLTARLAAVPPLLLPLARVAVARLAAFVLRLTGAVAAASSVTTALAVIEGLESEPFEAAVPRPAAERGLVGWWRTASGLGWVAVLAAPPLLVVGAWAGTAGGLGAALAAVLAVAASGGVVAALALAALVPRRILVPAAWTTATAAVVGAVLWLRALHPERLAASADPAALLAALGALGASRTAGHGFSGAVSTPAGALAAGLAGMAAAAAAWTALGRRAGERLARGEAGRRRRLAPWAVLDALLVRSPAGAFLAARLRHLARDAFQGSQMLYLVGLGVVYVQNLRALPLGDPLAVQLAGLLDLFMAGMLAAALAMRFAWPARLLGGPSWWWRTAPLGRLETDGALIAAALGPILALSWGLHAAAAAVIGVRPGWLVPFLAVWLTVAGVTLGPEPGDDAGRWIDAALGGGGLAFLAVAVLAVGWCTAASGAHVIVRIAGELGFRWRPPWILSSPGLPPAILTAGLLPAILLRRR